MLYLYPTENAARQKSLLDIAPWPADEAHGGRAPNLNPAFVRALAQQLGLTFRPHPYGAERLSDAEFGPEDIFHYIYAIFHSPTYRARYAEFLKIDFPRVPLTADAALFWSLCALGRRLVGLHLLDAPEVGRVITRYPMAGDNRIDTGYPRYAPPADGHPGRISINATQYFEGAPPDVWAFFVGGYQPAQKWLKDRRGRQLSYDDLTHYQQMLAALQQTMNIMTAIDAAIPEWPLR